MTLDDWLTESGTKERALAAMLECTPSTVSRIRRGLTMPEAPLISKITEITEGKVTANDLHLTWRSAQDAA